MANSRNAANSGSTANPEGRIPTENPKVDVDAYETGSWNGIVFVVDDAVAFQVRIGSFLVESRMLIDGDVWSRLLVGGDVFQDNPKAKLFNGVTEVGPHAPDKSYCRLVWNPAHPYDYGSRVRLEWSLIDSSTVVGRVNFDVPVNADRHWTGGPKLDLILEGYWPWGFTGDLSAGPDSIVGQSSYHRLYGEYEWNQWRFAPGSPDPEVTSEKELGFESGFHESSFDDNSWHMVRAGAYWQEDPQLQWKGYGWYRTRVMIPGSWKGKSIRLALGRMSEDDRTFLNGKLIGGTKGKDEERIYVIRPDDPRYEFVRWGEENVLALQVRGGTEFGGISSGRTTMGIRNDPPRRPRIEALELNSTQAAFAVVVDRPAKSFGSYANLDGIEPALEETQMLPRSNGNRYGVIQLPSLHNASRYENKDLTRYFVARVGSDQQQVVDACRRFLKPQVIDRLIEEKRVAYETTRVAVAGQIEEAPKMMTNTLHWTTLYSPEQKRAFVVDSRIWFMPDKWCLFANTGVMSALAASLENKKLAYDTMLGVMAEQLPDGRVMNASGSFAITPDRSLDMYAAYCAWKIYRKYPDKEWLKTIYPSLKKWHMWWFDDRGDGQAWRDGNGDGLLEIGSNIVAPDTPQDPVTSDAYWLNAQCAFWEGGYDDSPMWGSFQHPPEDAETTYLYRTGTLNLNLVCRNALYALSSECLLQMALELGYADDVRYFTDDYGRMKALINKFLWSEEDGLYLNRFWDEYGGRFSRRKSPTSFYPMAAGIPDYGRAYRLVHEHLLNPDEFWGEYVIPSISRDDPAFPGQYYWRGTIWPPMNYFVYEGLKRYGFDEIAADLALKTYKMLLPEWLKANELWENYNSITGEGAPHGAGNSTKHYSWSACLALLSIMELIDLEAWGGLRFGSLGFSRQTTVRNVEISGQVYEVVTGPVETALTQNGFRIFSIDCAAVVRNFQRTDEEWSFDLKTLSGGNPAGLIISGFTRGDSCKAEILINSKHFRTLSIKNDELKVEVPSGNNHISVRLR